MGIRISSLSANALPYTGREQIPLVQNATTRAGTLSSFVNYLSGDFAFVNRPNTFLGSQTIQGNLSVQRTLSATTVEAVSAKFDFVDIKQFETSGFDVRGDLNVVGKLSATSSVTFNSGLTAGNTVLFDVNNNTPALEIVQRGSGHSLLVKDELNDTTPFTITNDGRVGVGTSTPNETLTVVGNISATGNTTFIGSVTGSNPIVINVNSPSPALKITQTGSGNALVIEDNTSPDATPFIVTAAGSVLVGTSSQPTGNFIYSQIVSSGGAKQTIVSPHENDGVSQAIIRYSDNTTSEAYGAMQILAKSNTRVIGDQVAVVDDQPIGGVTLLGSDGSDFVSGASILARVDGAVATGSVPMAITISTRQAGNTGASPERMRIDSSGNVGIGTKTPNEKLTVFGNLSVSGSLSATMIEAISSRVTYLDIREYELSGFRATGPVIIETNSSDTTLRITQSGTGDVIRVEDELNPDASPFIINNSGSVGIGTSTPSEKLTVVGNISASGNLSATNIVSVGGAIRPTAGNTSNDGIKFPDNPGGGGGDSAWIRYYSRVGAAHNFEIGVNNDTDDHILLIPSGNVGIGTSSPNEKLAVTGNISATGSIYAVNTISTPTGDSTKWDSAYTNVNSNSANWQRGYTAFNGMTSLSANWQNTYTTVNTLSTTWDRGYTAYNGMTSLSANWQNSYTTVNSNSANWNRGYTAYNGMTSLSANWQSTYTTMTANSSSWNTVYSTVCAQSANWNRSTILNVSNTTVLLALSDSYDYIRLTNASPITIQIPILSWNMGTEITFRRTTSAGAITLSAGVGVTINDDGSASVLAGDTFIIKYISSNTWDFI